MSGIQRIQAYALNSKSPMDFPFVCLFLSKAEKACTFWGRKISITTLILLFCKNSKSEYCVNTHYEKRTRQAWAIAAYNESFTMYKCSSSNSICTNESTNKVFRYPSTIRSSCLRDSACNNHHTTKITLTSLISHFDIVWYYKNPIPLTFFDYVIIQNITSLNLWHNKK